MSYNRKKSQSQNSNYNNQSRGKARFSNNNNSNRPRKNYGAMREKYLTQARDALASGDRVLAENFFQHADHCFRMIAEENATRSQRVQAQQDNKPDGKNNSEAAEPAKTKPSPRSSSKPSSDNGGDISKNVSELPEFITKKDEVKENADKEQAPKE